MYRSSVACIAIGRALVAGRGACARCAAGAAAPTSAAGRSPITPSNFGAPDAPTVVPLGAGYKIAPLDTLTIKVFKMPDLSGDYEVDLTGQISMPLIGSVTRDRPDHRRSSTSG